MSDPVRTIAFLVLRAVDQDDAYVNLLLPRMLAEHKVTGRDAAFATELVHGTVRQRGTYDAVIDSLVSRALDPAVRDALRLGAHQVLSMRVPNHAAVSETVDVVRREIGHKPVGFVNAVLRKVGARSLEAWIEELTAGLDPDDARSVRSSHPRWVIEAFRDALDGDDDGLDALLAADNAPPRVTLVARPGLAEPEELPGEKGRHSPYARIMTDGDPGSVAAVREGRAGVQDEGSQLVALTLADAVLTDGDARWLDLCAGPGGKAALLGALAAQRGAHLVANEFQPHRAELVRSSMRLLPDVEVTEHDGRAGPWEAATFDRVLVDAPCTGLGALRRRPEARWRRRPEDLEALTGLQRGLLERALELTRRGGVTVYATCSPHRAETTGIVASVTADRDDVAVEATHQWWPHVDGTDAMFAAVLRRR